MRTFGLVFVPLISQKTQIGRENIEFLANGIKGFIQPRVSMLAWPLSGGTRWLKAPMLDEDEDIRRIEWSAWMGGRNENSDRAENLRLETGRSDMRRRGRGRWSREMEGKMEGK